MNLTSLILAACTFISIPAFSNPELKEAFALAKTAQRQMKSASSIAGYKQAIVSYQRATDIFMHVAETLPENLPRLNGDLGDVLWNTGVCYEAMAAFFVANSPNQAQECLTKSLELFLRAFQLYQASDYRWSSRQHLEYLEYVDSVGDRLLDLVQPVVPSVAIIEPAPTIERRRKRKQSEPQRSLNPQNMNDQNFRDFDSLGQL